MLTHESDLFGALKNTGSLNGRATKAEVASPEGGRDTAEHPIKPLIIGTSKDAQLEAAIDYLQRAVRGETGAHPG